MLDMSVRKPASGAGSGSGSQPVAGKSLSHMLTSHGGEIFIHNLNMGRSVLEDPPGISEGAGGRVTDYRIIDAAAMMKVRAKPRNGQPPAFGAMNIIIGLG